MAWIIVAIFIVGTGVTIGVLFTRVKGQRGTMDKALSYFQNEQKAKEDMIAEIGELSKGLTDPDTLEGAKKQTVQLGEELRSEEGRYTITQAEFEAIEARLRELEEIERELEASSLEAAKEVEMLQAQEKDIRERNEELKVELDDSFAQLELVMGRMESNQEVVSRLADAKARMDTLKERIEWYTQEITNLNGKYMDLKNGYDALDIEYAQLYEKQNQLDAMAAAADQ